MDYAFRSGSMKSGFQECLISGVAVYIGSYFSDEYLHKEDLDAFLGFKAERHFSVINSSAL